MGVPLDLRDLVDELDAIVFEADAQTCALRFINRRAESLLGYPIDRWLAEPGFWAEHIHPEDRAAAVEFCRTETEAGRDHVCEYRFLAADGRIVWLRNIVRVVADEHGRPAWLRGLMIDISDTKGVQEALARSEASRQTEEGQFRALIENGTDLVSILDPDGVVRYASPSHERWVGWKPEELVGRNAFELVHPDDLPALVEKFAAGIGIPGYVATHEFRYRTRDGGWRRLEGRAASRLDDPAIRGAVINLRDVTERHEAEEALRRRLATEEIAAEVARTLARAKADELEAAVDDMLATLGEHLGAAHVFVALFGHGQRTWSVRCEWHEPTAHPLRDVLKDVPVRRHERMFVLLEEQGWASVERRSDANPQGPVLQTMARLDLASGIGVRMAVHGQALGFLACLYRDDVRRWSDADRELLRLLAEICSNAIARKREEDVRSALLGFTRRIGASSQWRRVLHDVLPEIAGLLDGDIVATFLAAEADAPLRVVAAWGLSDEHAETAQRVVGKDHPVFAALRSHPFVVANSIHEQAWFPIEELERIGVAHFLIAPLHLEGRMRGALGVGRRAGTRPFGDRDVDLLSGMARQVALAIESAESQSKLQVEARVASALARVGGELISSLDEPTLLERLAHTAAEVLGAEVAHVYVRRDVESDLTLAASYGESTEEVEALRLVPLAVGAAAPDWGARFASCDVFEQDGDALQLGGLGACGTLVHIALRRGGRLGGVLVAGWRPSSGLGGDEERLRIGRGISHVASLALGNVRIVEELERVSRLKSDFLATMSHELRTPLNVILGYSDLLRDGAFAPVGAEQDEILARIQRSGIELLELINATLDVSRFEAGTVPVHREPVDVASLLATLEAEMPSVDVTRDVQVRWVVDGAIPSVVTDPLKLKVILKNLVGNALKFTERGEVCVRVTLGDGEIEIAVRDTGIGIPAEEQTSIFEAFQQGDSSSTRRHGGVGLGLYIVQQMLALLGGSIEVESERGVGSEFRVRLPL